MSFTKRDLQTVFRGYRGIDAKMERTLNMYGFTVVRNRNHSILLYTVNGKTLKFTASKTGSDYRAGLNLASVIYNSIFYEAAKVAA